MSPRSADIAAARAQLGDGAIAAWAPGRCSVVGDHLDYAGGRVLACALDGGVAVAAVASADARWRVRSGASTVTADAGAGEGIARLPMAAVRALREGELLASPPLEMAIVASLPSGGGLSSSAAITCAVICLLLQRETRALPARRVADLAWVAEHDIAGVPCGRLDQRAVVEAPAGGMCAVDLGTDRTEPLPWPWDDVTLVVADSGERHDVGAPGYAALRHDAESVLILTGAATASALRAADVRALPVALRARGEHLVAETRHVRDCEAALAAADRSGFGRALTASHADQCRLLGNSTARIDAMVAAVTRVPGCHGARMVGAGFGGSVLAVCDTAATAGVLGCLGEGARVVIPSPGLAALEPGVVAPPPTLRQP